ncbi:hypothetical protein [Nocardia sp. NPDC051832]|uniref:hypothetical protein n=1 Tax=Nocardia sp. NPDC051832 TaxID=3155673 RepID=UPI0034367562
MNSGRGLPNPVRSEPALPAGIVVAAYAATTIAAGICGGGALSGLLAGHGLVVAGPGNLVPILIRLIADPGSPAAAWPGDPRPGPAWLTWLCIGIVAAVWCSTAVILSDLVDKRWRKRRRPGLAGAADLRRVGLDRRRAFAKARHEYPSLTQRRRWRR